MTTESIDPFERAEVIKKLEERWLLKSQERENTPLATTPKKARTSLTNPVIKNIPASKQSEKNQSV